MGIREEYIQEWFLKLVTTDSHSKQEGAVADLCEQELRRLGFSVERDSAGEQLGGETGNVIATLPGDDSQPPILLAAHMDTVQPGQSVKPQIRDGVVYSDGTTVLGADDKAGITAIFAALDALRASGAKHGPIQVVLTIAEEIGLQGASHLDWSKVKASMGLSLDSSGKLGTLAIAGPGQAKFDVVVRGRKAHAGGEPEKGISAIKVAAEAVACMPHGRIDHETTANIGTFVGQGPTNVVADMVRLEGEARSRSPKRLEETLSAIETAFQTVAKKHGATVEFSARHMYEGFRFGEDDLVRRRAEAALGECGFSVDAVEVGGGSDANVFCGNGIPVINIGIGYEEIHTTNEHIRLRDIYDAARVALAFCTQEDFV